MDRFDEIVARNRAEAAARAPRTWRVVTDAQVGEVVRVDADLQAAGCPLRVVVLRREGREAICRPATLEEQAPYSAAVRDMLWLRKHPEHADRF